MAAVVNYFEVGTPEPEKAQAFYGPLFDWTFGAPSPAAYRMVDEGAGGLWDTTGIGSGSWAVFYVQVEDVQAAVDRAVELGGHILLPPVDNGAIEFAHLADPSGNRFGVWRPKV